MGKRGQVTVFIILAIVIIVSAALYFYIKEKTSYFRPEIIVPTELMPIDAYIKDCVSSTAKAAVIRLGLQSGFVEVPKEIKAQRASYIALDPYGSFMLPYWTYKAMVRYPTTSFMQNQISDYVKANLPDCLRGFASFRQGYGFEAKNSKMAVKTEISDDEVRVGLKYPIIVTDKATTKKTTLENFEIALPVRLKRIHSLAEKVLRKELDDLYLENLTINLMALHPDIPFTGMRFDCGKKRWYANEIKEELQTLLYLTLPRLRVKNTNYIPFDSPKSAYDELDAYKMEDIQENRLPDTSRLPNDYWEYLRLLWDVNSETPELSIGFSYIPAYGMDLMAYPSKNGVLEERSSKGAAQFLKFMCINIYHFVYDVNYPIKVSIRDSSAFSSEGFVFSFVLPVNIYHNAPNKQETSISPFEGMPTTDGFCDALGSDSVEVVAKGFYDGLSNMEISGVNISYACFNEFCELGQTRLNNGRYSLITRLPSGCSNPFLVAKAAGYLESKQQYTGGNYFEIPVKSMLKLNFTVVKHYYNSQSGVIDTSRSLEPGETAALYIRTLGTSQEQFLIYNLTSSSGGLELAEEGALYDIDISLTKDSYTGTSLVGGYYVTNLSISGIEIAGRKNALFHVFEYRPEPADEAAKIAFAEYIFGAAYKEALRPTFK